MGKRRPVVCGLCEREIPYTDAIHSRTGRHYCKDNAACARVVMRQKKVKA